MNTVCSIFNVIDFGAICDGVTDDTQAVQDAIDACHEAGGGVVVIPAGKCVRIGTVRLKSFVELHLEKEGSCENIAVTNCTMISKSFAINLGCEVDAPIRNCIFSNCVIKNSHRGIGIHLSEHSNIENVIFSDCYVETRYYPDCWWGAAEPIYIVSIPWTKNDTVGYIKNLLFKNIICRSENGVIVYGDKTAEIDGVVFSDVHVTLDKFAECEGGRFDLRPCEGDENGYDAGVFEHDTSGFYIENAKGIRMTNCSVTWGDNRAEYFKEALTIIDGAEVEVQGFSEK